MPYLLRNLPDSIASFTRAMEGCAQVLHLEPRLRRSRAIRAGLPACTRSPSNLRLCRQRRAKISPLPTRSLVVPLALDRDRNGRRKSPAGPNWLHEVKHDGYRVGVRHRARCTQHLHPARAPLVDRMPSIARALSALKMRSAVIDGEARAIGRNDPKITSAQNCAMRDDHLTSITFGSCAHSPSIFLASRLLSAALKASIVALI